MTTQFDAALKELYDEDVEFIIVGAFAAVLQGSDKDKFALPELKALLQTKKGSPK